MYILHPGRTGIWKSWWREENPRSRDENQQQTQPTYGTGPKSNPGHIGVLNALTTAPSPLPYDRTMIEWVESILKFNYCNLFFCVCQVWREGKHVDVSSVVVIELPLIQRRWWWSHKPASRTVNQMNWLSWKIDMTSSICRYIGLAEVWRDHYTSAKRAIHVKVFNSREEFFATKRQSKGIAFGK